MSLSFADKYQEHIAPVVNIVSGCVMCFADDTNDVSNELMELDLLLFDCAWFRFDADIL